MYLIDWSSLKTPLPIHQQKYDLFWQYIEDKNKIVILLMLYESGHHLVEYYCFQSQLGIYSLPIECALAKYIFDRGLVTLFTLHSIFHYLIDHRCYWHSDSETCVRQVPRHFKMDEHLRSRSIHVVVLSTYKTCGMCARVIFHFQSRKSSIGLLLPWKRSDNLKFHTSLHSPQPLLRSLSRHITGGGCCFVIVVVVGVCCPFLSS